MPVNKRLIDIVLCLLLLPVFCIVGLLTSILVWLFLGKPLFFKQRRPGFKGKLFIIYKFRSMTEKYDEKGELMCDEERLTKFGIWLRSTSLDELPVVLNVLRGEMSLVGPRPLLEEYLPLYSEEQKRRHEVVPGITGWAQINGRNVLTWEQKFRHDIWYVDNFSIVLDLKILALTIVKVLTREGVRQLGHATMRKFQGN